MTLGVGFSGADLEGVREPLDTLAADLAGRVADGVLVVCIGASRAPEGDLAIAGLVARLAEAVAETRGPGERGTVAGAEVLGVIADAKGVLFAHDAGVADLSEPRATLAVGGVVGVEVVLGPTIDGAVVADAVDAVGVARTGEADGVGVVVVPAVLARAVEGGEGRRGGVHAVVGAVVGRVVEAPVAGQAGVAGRRCCRRLRGRSRGGSGSRIPALLAE